MTKHIICLLAFAMVILCASCGERQTGKETDSIGKESHALTLSDFSWLQGRWEMPMPEGILFEEWVPDGDTLKGAGGLIRGMDTSVSETIVLTANDTGIFYIPTVKNQNGGAPIAFRLTSIASDSFVFENPAHDFPQAICYKKQGDTAMVARIWGTIKGKTESEQFAMRRAR
ncbi:MAG: hypothetical protein KF744_17230 [Taibaiella sp.]|nr:hypothetical protein [Taibaiella sp.]